MSETEFHFHVGHDVLGRHYLSVKWIRSRTLHEVDLDLTKPYTLAELADILKTSPYLGEL